MSPPQTDGLNLKVQEQRGVVLVAGARGFTGVGSCAA